MSGSRWERERAQAVMSYQHVDRAWVVPALQSEPRSLEFIPQPCIMSMSLSALRRR